MAQGAATAMWSYRARVIAYAPAEAMMRRLPAAIQIEPIDESTCRLHVGSSSAESLAEYLALLGVDFTIEEPEGHHELIAQLRSLSERFHRAARSLNPCRRLGQTDVAQVLHHHIGACHSQRLPVAPPIHADHASETTGPARRHTGHRILDHDGCGRFHPQP